MKFGVFAVAQLDATSYLGEKLNRQRQASRTREPGTRDEDSETGC
jgi:hypothetical protein